MIILKNHIESMDISTVNIIIGGVVSVIGAGILFVLGAVVSYIRSLNKSMKELLIMAVEHRTRLDAQDKHMERIDADVQEIYNRLNKGA